MSAFTATNMSMDDAKSSACLGSSVQASPVDILDDYVLELFASSESKAAESGLSASELREVDEVFEYENRFHASTMTLYNQVRAQYDNHEVRPTDPISAEPCVSR